MAVTKKFKEKFSYFSIPKPYIHNIVRGTDDDIPGFWLNIYVITAMHRNKQFYKKNFSVSFKEIFDNTPIPYTTLRDYQDKESIRHSKLIGYTVGRKDNKYFFWVYNRTLDTHINKMNYIIKDVDLSTPTEEEKDKGYTKSYYALKADKHFAGYVKLSKSFLKIIHEAKLNASQLRVLLCVMNFVVNPKPGFFPSINIKTLSGYTTFKPFKIVKILNELYEKGLIICEHLDKIKSHPQVMYIGKGLDESAISKIEDYLEIETAKEFEIPSGIPSVEPEEFNELL